MTIRELENLIKGRKQPTAVGPRGGHYYLAGREKVYVQPGKTDPPMAHILADTPHAGGPTESAVVQVQVLPPGRGGKGQRMFVHAPKGIEQRRAASQADKLAQARWTSFACKNCGSLVVPHHDIPVVSHATGDIAAVSKTPTGRTEAFTEGGDKIKYQGEQLRVHITRPGADEPEVHHGMEPEAVAARMCPSCFQHDQVLSRTRLPDQDATIKLTAAEKRQARQALKEAQKADQRLQTALAKQRERKPLSATERALVARHHAVEADRQRAEEAKAKLEERLAGAPGKRAEADARAEERSRDEVRAQLMAHLVEQGVEPDDAADRAAYASPAELATFITHQRRAKVDADLEAAAKRHAEMGAMRPAAVFDPEPVQARYEARRRGLKAGEARVAFKEVLALERTPLDERLKEEAAKPRSDKDTRFSMRAGAPRKAAKQAPQRGRLFSDKEKAKMKKSQLWIRL